CSPEPAATRFLRSRGTHHNYPVGISVSVRSATNQPIGHRCSRCRGKNRPADSLRNALSLLGVASLPGFPLISDESCNSVIGNQCYAAQFSPLTNAYEPPVAALLAFAVVAAAKPKVGIAARLR